MEILDAWVLSYLLNTLCQAPLWFAAGWLVARLLRPFGAGWEHRVWVLTLLLQSSFVAASLMPAGWTRWLHFWALTAARIGTPHVTVVTGGGTTVGGLPWSTVWLLLAGRLYALILVWFAARFVWRALQLRRLRREARRIVLTGQVQQQWAACCRRLAIQDALLAASPSIAGPVTMGIRRKLVLLPEAMAHSVGQDDLQAVFAHEGAHIRRNDFAKNLAYELLSLPVAYHPLTWLVRRRITETREMICDQMAATMTGPSAYARSLLRLAALVVQGMPASVPHAIGIFDAHVFERRLMNIKARKNQLSHRRRIAGFVTCAVLTTATCGVAVGLGLHVDQAPAGASTSKSHRLSVSAKEMSGNLINKAVPLYPPDAKKAKIQGKVVLQAVIGKNGNVESLRVLSGPKELQQSALDAVRQWTYKPYLLNGDPVEVETTINVIYSLAG